MLAEASFMPLEGIKRSDRVMIKGGSNGAFDLDRAILTTPPRSLGKADGPKQILSLARRLARWTNHSRSAILRS